MFKTIADSASKAALSILDADNPKLVTSSDGVTIGMQKIAATDLPDSGLTLGLASGSDNNGATVNIAKNKCSDGNSVVMVYSDSMLKSLAGAENSKKSFEISMVAAGGTKVETKDSSLDPTKG